MNILHIQCIEKEKDNGSPENLLRVQQELKGKIVSFIDPIREVELNKQKAWVLDIFAVESPKVFKEIEKVHKINGWQIEKGERARQ